LGLPFLGAILAPLKISILRLTPIRGEIFLTRRSNGTHSKKVLSELKRRLTIDDKQKADADGHARRDARHHPICTEVGSMVLSQPSSRNASEKI
jgi:hypothetical protein